MAYKKKTWRDRVAEFPDRVIARLVAGEDNQYDVARADGEAEVPGDALDAANLNDLESRISEGFVQERETTVEEVAQCKAKAKEELEDYKEQANGKFLQFVENDGFAQVKSPTGDDGYLIVGDSLRSGKKGTAVLGAMDYPWKEVRTLQLGAKNQPVTTVYANTLVGNVTGDVTGDVKGNLTGNVTGNVTGSLAGTVKGDVTGNLKGNVTGDLKGNVTGNVTGNISGNAATATKLAKAVQINGVAFDGSKSIEIDTGEEVDLSGYATQQWVEGKGYSTQKWVEDKKYASQSWVEGKSYTTQQWVEGKGYATTPYVDSAMQNKANAKKPQLLAFNFENGIVGNLEWSHYYKDEFGKVHIALAPKKDAGYKHGDILAYLPVGFRHPTTRMGMGVGASTASAVPIAVTINEANGAISVRGFGSNTISGVTGIYIDLSFFPTA